MLPLVFECRSGDIAKGFLHPKAPDICTEVGKVLSLGSSLKNVNLQSFRFVSVFWNLKDGLEKVPRLDFFKEKQRQPSKSVD